MRTALRHDGPDHLVVHPAKCGMLSDTMALLTSGCGHHQVNIDGSVAHPIVHAANIDCPPTRRPCSPRVAVNPTRPRRRSARASAGSESARRWATPGRCTSSTARCGHAQLCSQSKYRPSGIVPQRRARSRGTVTRHHRPGVPLRRTLCDAPSPLAQAIRQKAADSAGRPKLLLIGDQVM